MEINRIYLCRHEIRSVDTYKRNYTHINYMHTFIEGKLFRTLDLYVVNKKGNKSRLLTLYPTEIEGTGNLYYLTYSDRLIRKREHLEDYCGRRYAVKPIARCVLTNDVIYSISQER